MQHLLALAAAAALQVLCSDKLQPELLVRRSRRSIEVLWYAREAIAASLPTEGRSVLQTLYPAGTECVNPLPRLGHRASTLLGIDQYLKFTEVRCRSFVIVHQTLIPTRFTRLKSDSSSIKLICMHNVNSLIMRRSLAIMSLLCSILAIDAEPTWSAPAFYKGLEGPKYSVVRNGTGWELRRYEPGMIAPCCGGELPAAGGARLLQIAMMPAWSP